MGQSRGIEDGLVVRRSGGVEAEKQMAGLLGGPVAGSDAHNHVMDSNSVARI